MADKEGFLKYDRELPPERDPKKRIKDYEEIYEPFSEEKTTKQAARCMDCGIPFCHQGCPLGNIIPDFNGAVYEKDWERAYEILADTNNFPEFTGRICPAPCETSCVLSIHQSPVTIEYIEKSIAETAFERGYVKPVIPQNRTGKKVAVIGSGPAGLGAAAQLNKAGHNVTVFERDDQIGGLLTYGIPDFKLEKWVVARRIEVMKQEGIEFKTKVEVGKDISTKTLEKEYEAILLCTGATIPRDLPIPGRNLKGVHFAMDFLTQQNRRVAGLSVDEDKAISATGKHVVVIGGGDTGSDCVGTSNRHKAQAVVQIELLEKPPHERSEDNPWPEWPMVIRTSSSHDEGVDREWALLTKRFIGDKSGKVTQLEVSEISWHKDEQGKMHFTEREGSTRNIPCDLALIAIGFTGPESSGIVKQLGLKPDARGNIQSQGYKTSKANIFAAGDCRRGQSLVVWAIAEGREAARAIDLHLMGETLLEAKDHSFFQSND